MQEKYKYRIGNTKVWIDTTLEESIKHHTVPPLPFAIVWSGGVREENFKRH